MDTFSLLGIAVGLAMDALAVSIAAGASLGRATRREAFRLAWHFGFFQFFMPIIGWGVGSSVASQIARYDHWIAAGILIAIGSKMLVDALFSRNDDDTGANPTKGWMLVTLSLATSIDAFAVGLGMALMDVPIFFPCIVIGLVAGVFTAAGITFAARILGRWGRRADVLGGVVLIGIGVRVWLTQGM